MIFGKFLGCFSLLLFSTQSVANSEVGYAHRENKKSADRVAREKFLKDPVGTCLKDSQVANGASVKVNTTAKFLCKDEWGPINKLADSQITYAIKKLNNQILVNVDVDWVYIGETKNKAQVMENLKVSKVCAEDFYSKYGIQLKINAIFDAKPVRKSSRIRINVHDECERTDSSNWCVLKENGHSRTNKTLCSLVAHEIGHNLGLPDRYPDQMCPDRDKKSFASTNDLMNGGGGSVISKLFMSSRDAAIILAPLCDNP